MQIKKNNRVFTPKEADQIYDKIPKRKFKRGFDTALNTGMRYKELRLLVENPNWYNPKKSEIFLPGSHTKIKKERYVHLTTTFNKLLGEYLETGLYFPDRRTWFDNIRRWSKLAGIEDWENINVKTTRKTWESWLVRAGYDPMRILLSQGHIQATALIHYLNLSFTKEEIESIKEKTNGWTG